MALLKNFLTGRRRFTFLLSFGGLVIGVGGVFISGNGSSTIASLAYGSGRIWWVTYLVLLALPLVFRLARFNFNSDKLSTRRIDGPASVQPLRIGRLSIHVGRIPDTSILWNRIHLVARASFVLLSAILVGYPRLIQVLPIGADTLWYIHVVNTMDIDGPGWAFNFTDRPLLFWTLYLTKHLFSLTTLQAFQVFPIFLAALFTVGTWLYVGNLTREHRYRDQATTLAVFFAASSPTVLRSTIDLYGSMLGLTILLFSLTYLVKASESSSARDAIVLSILLTMLLLSYWFLWAIVLVILLLSSRLRRLTLFAGLPSLLLFSALLAYSALNPPPEYWGLGRSMLLYLGAASTPEGALAARVPEISFYPLDGDLQYFLGEGNFLVFFLGIIGLLSMNPFDLKQRTLYLWAFLLTLPLTTGQFGTHAALALPLPILAGFGMAHLLNVRIHLNERRFPDAVA